MRLTSTLLAASAVAVVITGTCLVAAGTSNPPGGGAIQDVNRLRAILEHREHEIERLSRELERFNAATGQHMRELMIAAATFADANGNRLPQRSSDLREFVGWSALLAPYDATPERLAKLRAMADPWAWLDEHGSYEWLGGDHDFNSQRIILIERRFKRGEARWMLFGDGHVEYVSDGGYLHSRLREAGVDVSASSEKGVFDF